MSVYVEKIYPDIASAPEDDQQDTSQTYRLKKIEEAEQFLREEIKTRDQLTKKFKRVTKPLMKVNSALISTSVLLGSSSVVTFFTVVGAPIGASLACATLAIGVLSGVGLIIQKAFDSKKHDKIKTLAESKLDSISELVSKAIEDTNISHEEYQFILKEVKHYRTMKEEIRTKSKKAVDKITAEQREAILAQGREEGKKNLLSQIAASSATPTVNAT